MTFTKNKLNLFFILFLNFFLLFFPFHSAITTNDSKTKNLSTLDLSSEEDVATGNSTFDGIINGIKSMTCETMHVYEVFADGAFNNSCITSTALGVAFAYIAYPTAVPLMMRLRISDKQLFGKNQCSVKNNADYNDPRITFGICSNVKISFISIKLFVVSVAKLTMAFGGGDWNKMWKSFADIIFGQEYYKEMFEIYKDKKVGDSGILLDVGSLPISWSIITQQDTICVATKGFFGALFDATEYLPIGCKYMSEPYTKSIYADVVTGQTDNKQTQKYKSCSNFGTCYKNVTDNSKALRSITSIIVYCTYQVLTKALVSPDVCSITDAKDKLSSGTVTKGSLLYKVQDNLRSFVKLFLLLYTISIGYKMMVYGSAKEDIMMISLKIILVVYFSIGIDLRNHKNERQDGISGFTLPLLMSASNSFASWVMNAGSSGLCNFPQNEYVGNYQFLALWDSVDCRLGHYLGIDMFADFHDENSKKNDKWGEASGLSFSVPPYLYLLAIGLFTGFTALTELALAYPILIISVIAYFVQVFISSVIMILVFGIMAPLFVPMVLLDATKGYFNKWLNIIISFSLKPMVVSAFIIVMFSLYDRSLYGTCKHSAENYNGKKIFVLKDNKRDYLGRAEDYENCIYSLGYIFHSPRKDSSKISNNDFLNQNYESKNFSDAQKNNKFLSDGVETEKGVFSDFFIGIFSKLEKILMSMLVGCITLYLIQVLAEQLERFLADLSMGVNSNALESSFGKGFEKALNKRNINLNITPSNISSGLKTASSFAARNISSGLKTASSFAASKLSNARKNATKEDTKIEPESDKNTETNNNTETTNNQLEVFSEERSNFQKSLLLPGGEEKKIENVKIDSFGPNKGASSKDIKEIIEKFHQDKNVNLFKSEGDMMQNAKEGENNLQFSYEEFSRYVANMGKAEQSNKYHKFKDAYSATLERYLEDNPLMKKNADELALRLENSIGGEQANDLREINTGILNKLGVSRTLTLKDIEPENSDNIKDNSELSENKINDVKMDDSDKQNQE